MQRNALYRRSGEVARDLIETVRGAPLEEGPIWPIHGKPLVTLINVPRMYGGDFLSGAYLFRHDDIYNALAIFEPYQDEIQHVLKCSHAHDYTALASFDPDGSIRLRVGFRTRRAYEEALRRNLVEDRNGDVAASLEDVDAGALTLSYRLTLPGDFWDDPRRELLLYSDDRFQRLRPDL